MCPDLQRDIEGDDRRSISTDHQIVDRSKLVPMGTQHDMISDTSKGLCSMFHPMSGAKDFEGRRVTAFMNYPYEVGQIVGKGSSVSDEMRTFATLECKHTKRSAKDLKVKQVVYCKKCAKHRTILAIDHRVVPVVSKKSKDDLLYMNSKIFINQICGALNLGPVERSCLGDVFDEAYQSAVNIFEKIVPLYSFLSMQLNYKGLGLLPAEEYKKAYSKLLGELREILISPIQKAQEELGPIEQPKIAHFPIRD